MRAFFKLASVAAVVLTGALLAPQSAPAEHIACGAFVNINVVTVPGNQTTDAAAYSQIASTQADINGSTCVLVQFSAQFSTKTPKNVRLRVTLDGQPSGFPNFANVTTSGNGYDERALTFLITGAGGTSDIGIQFSSPDLTPVTVRNGVLRVAYAAAF
jgi:hypothetical protein